jgi:hypothetical protein
MLVLVASFALSSCSDGSAKQDPSLGGAPQPLPGDASAYTVGGVSFTMRYVPTSQCESDDYLISGGSYNVMQLPGILNPSA